MELLKYMGLVSFVSAATNNGLFSLNNQCTTLNALKASFLDLEMKEVEAHEQHKSINVFEWKSGFQAQPFHGTAFAVAQGLINLVPYAGTAAASLLALQRVSIFPFFLLCWVANSYCNHRTKWVASTQTWNAISFFSHLLLFYVNALEKPKFMHLLFKIKRISDVTPLYPSKIVTYL